MPSPRFKYHFEPQKGWMNDPNGLIYYKGKYHVFFQHNPYSTKWDKMHWGHAVSDNLIDWEELTIALYPDKEYENTGGCFSGSAIEKDGKLYLFYTSVSDKYGQTQSVAISSDGIYFEKYEGNPVIFNPLGLEDFRDPNVLKIDDVYYMVVGSGSSDGGGKVLLFSSSDLLKWDYDGILYEDNTVRGCIECPNFFKLDGKYILMYSRIGESVSATTFAAGDFMEGKLVNVSVSAPEYGIDFYAPQTFEHNGRRIMIGWLSRWGREAGADEVSWGGLSIPRVLSLRGSSIIDFPVEEAVPYMTKQSNNVIVSSGRYTITGAEGINIEITENIDTIDIFEDTKSIEVFINGGQKSYSLYTESK